MKIYFPMLTMMLIFTQCQNNIEHPISGKKVNPDEKIVETSREALVFPVQIPLPNGFQPEGIESGKGSEFYVGSLMAGAIYKGDFRTGQGSILVPQQPGRSAVGLCYDERSDNLFVSGGPTGKAFVYKGKTGERVAEIVLTTTTSTFINDCIVTHDAVYFTDSFQPLFYKISLGPAGNLPSNAEPESRLFKHDYTFGVDFNDNGIVAPPDGKQLIIGKTNTGELFLVDPKTGDAELIDLGGGSVPFVDGLVLEGKTLYVVQNFLNQITVIKLQSDYLSGEIVGVITNDGFRIPATATLFGNMLYAVNARFDVSPTPSTEYDIIGVGKHDY